MIFFKRLSVLASVCLLLACGGKENTPEQMEHQLNTIKEKLGQPRMQEYHEKGTVEWNGANYHYEIKRNSCDSLYVTNENGDKFYDNTVAVSITRNGDPFFSKQFTKRSFANYLPSDFMKNGVLEAVVFDKAEPNGLYFAASVCYPQSDMFVPLTLVIASNGSITISKDTTLDTAGTGEEMENAPSNSLHDL